jgi:DNA-binding CsgD family transcriptional regulator
VAVRLLRRALAEPPDATVRPAALAQLGQYEHDLDLAGAAEHLWEAAQAAEDPDLRARALLRLGAAGGMRLEMPPGFEELFDRELARARERDYELWLGMMASQITADWLNTAGRARALERLESLRHLSGKSPGEAIVLSIAARIELDRGAPASVVADLARRAAASRPARGEQGPSSPLVLHTAIALRHCELLDESDAVLEDALAVSRERGTATGFAIASANRAGNARRRGDLRRAEADARAALASGGTRGWYRLGATTHLIEALIDLGRLDEASEALAEAGLRDGPVPEIRPATPILIARGCLRHARGELEAAEVDYVDALARIARHTPGNTVGLDARLGLAEIHHLTGREKSALTMAREAVAITDHWGTPGLRGIARRTLARVTGGEAGIDMLRQAIALLEQSPFPLELAAAQIDLGASLRRAGLRADAREPLRAGLAAAEAAAASPLIDRSRQELAATGMRVRRGPSHDVLTPSEQRIAEMAAGGASNPEIAQALFVTIKTVETHLGNAYRKLDIKSRHDLPRALAERPTG